MSYRAFVARVMDQRKSFHRESEDVRRGELVNATLSCIATLGMERTTVREIAIKAGVTPGLIRHYFTSKEELVLAAYRQYVETLSERSRAAVLAAPQDAVSRLATFIAVNLSAPIVNKTNLSLWAGFIEAVRVNQSMASIHREGYMDYRHDAEHLISQVLDNQKSQTCQLEAPQLKAPQLKASQLKLRGFGIALNAIIDGLWLEGSMSPEEFFDGELAQLGLETASALLGVNLKIKGAN